MRKGTFKETHEVKELYDLNDDIGETINVYDRHPDVVAKLEGFLEECRRDLGDSAKEITGANVIYKCVLQSSNMCSFSGKHGNRPICP